MARPKPSPAPAAPVGCEPTPLASRLHDAALLIVVAVAAVRPTLAEEWAAVGQWSDLPVAGADAPAWPTPSVSMGLSLMVAAAGVLWVAAQVFAGRFAWRPVGGLAGVLLLAGGVVASIGAAVQYRAAVNTAVVFLGQLGLFVLAVQLLRRPWQIRWLAIALLASLLLAAGKGAYQVFVELPDTRVFYESRKAGEAFAEALARSVDGAPAAADDDEAAELDDRSRRWFEERLTKGSATGWVIHSNVYGSLMAMGLIAALGVAADGLRHRTGAARRIALAAAVAGVAVLALALLLSRSRGAMITGAAGAAAFVLFAWRPAWAVRNKWSLAAAGAALLAVGVGTVVTIGLRTGRLPGETLNYRWQYWTATARLLADRDLPGQDGQTTRLTGMWLTGVGPANFGALYPAVMAEGAIEEVRNPHCVPLQALAEFGIAGAAGLLLWVGWLTVRTVRLAGTGPEPAPPPTLLAGDEAARTAAVWRLLTCGGLTAGAVAAIWAWVGRPADFGLTVLFVAMPAMVWLFLFAAWHGEPAEPSPLSDAPVDHTFAAAGCALAAALVHGLIDHNLFWPAGGTVIAALAAVLVAAGNLKRPPDVQERTLPAPLPVGGLTLLTAVVLLGVFHAKLWQPAAEGDRLLADARTRMLDPRGPEDIDAAHQRLRRAAELDPNDPTPWEGLVDFHGRRFRSFSRHERDLAAGRLSDPKLDVTDLRARWRDAAMAELGQLRQAALELARRRPTDAGPWTLLADLHRSVAARYAETAALEGNLYPTNFDGVPVIGPVMGRFLGRAVMLNEANRHVSLAESAAQQAWLRKPNDPRLVLVLARTAELRRDRRAAAFYRRALELSAAAEEFGEGLPEPARREARRALERLTAK